ncbi:hypothetical protein MOUN0_L02410 [Monosporozyma unispora]
MPRYSRVQGSPPEEVQEDTEIGPSHVEDETHEQTQVTVRDSFDDLDSLDVDNEELPCDDNEILESLEFEDPMSNSIPRSHIGNIDLENNAATRAIHKICTNINDNVLKPVKSKIIEPISELEVIITRKLDKYLNEFGNPLILRKFLYMIFISIIVWIIWRSGFIFEYSNGTTFSNHDEMLKYVNNHIDFNKLETDLEYLTSMSHRSGTQGDNAIKEYIRQSMDNVQLDKIEELEYQGYVNYPDPIHNSVLNLYHGNDEVLEIDLNELNFMPLTINDQLNKTNIIYGHYGTESDYIRLTKGFLLEDPFIILLHYAPNDSIPISEQIMLAQRYNAQGVIFISTEYHEDYNDVIQQRSAALLQYGAGDVLSVGGSARGYLDLLSQKRTKLLPYVSVLSLSANQGKIIQSKLSPQGSVKFENGWYSGNANDVQAWVNVTSVVKQRQPIYNVVGKIEGGEQNEKAIIIGAARNSLHPGALYPNFGTTYLLTLMDLLQELKYKYNWTPMRSIYFISFGGTEYNYIGSTEFVQKESLRLRKEIFAYIDISQMSMDEHLDVMSHPLLNTLLSGFNNTFTSLPRNISMMRNYGDWTPFLANGIATAALTSRIVNEKRMPIGSAVDTFASIKEKLHDKKGQDQIKYTINYTMGIILRLIDAPIIPFNMIHFTTILDEKIYDLRKRYDTHLNFNHLIRSLLQWKKLSQEWMQWESKWNRRYNVKDHSIKVEEPYHISKERWEWNLKLSHIGKKTIYDYGLPNREFYKNVIVGPPFWSSYGTRNIDDNGDSKTIKYVESNGSEENLWLFPSLHDAIWKGDWASAQEQLTIISKILNEAGHSISRESLNHLNY